MAPDVLILGQHGAMGCTNIFWDAFPPLFPAIQCPCLMNIQVIPFLGEGKLLSDVVAVLGSLDFVMGEVDR